MAEVDVNVGSKRRLPLWMLGVTASDPLKRSKNDGENLTSATELSSIHTAYPKAKPVTRRLEHTEYTKEKVASEVDLGSLVDMDKAERCNGSGKIAQEQAAKRRKKLTKHGSESKEEIEMNALAGENRALEVNSGTLIRCERRTRTRKKGKQDEDNDASITSSSVSGKQMKKVNTRSVQDKRTVRKHTVSKKEKLKKYGTRSSEDISASSTEGSEDEELTMEDLMSMAEEYVKASEEKECLHSTIQKPEPNSQLLSPALIYKNESGGSLQANGNVQEISSCTRTAGSNPGLGGTERKENENLTSGIRVPSVRTGDPAQDMLELLLGPLLKKPQAEERTLNLLREDMIIAGDFNKNITSQVRVEQEAPLTKKKSSLKDKVAMFLD